MAIDLLIINALHDELRAVLQLGDTTSAAWKHESDPSGFPYHLRTFALPEGEQLTVAAAWSGAMGETAAVGRARTLIDFLDPLALAMCGICAGRKGDVFLGDVIVADRVFSYDHGKIVASNESGHRVEQIFHDIETYNLEKAWAMNVPYFAQAWHEDWHKQRPPSLDSQRDWALRCLYAHQEEHIGPSPHAHPERKTRCPSWESTLQSLLTRKLAILERGTLKITEEGSTEVLNNRVRYADGPPSDPPFRVHLGPIATGKTVRLDADLFPWLARFSRKILGVEMEAAAIGWIAELSGIPCIVAKAVSDYGDGDKDDGFRAFACRASAEFLLRFLSRHPPRTVNKHKVLKALQASGHKLGALEYAPPAPATIKPGAERTSPLDLSTPAGRDDERDNLYRETRSMALVHVLTPSDNPGQKYDIFIYAKRHRDADISDVHRAEFFFGKWWGNRIFPGTVDGNRIGIRTSAHGPFLCTCRITFADDYQVTLHRYIDFEMGDVVAKLAEAKWDTRLDQAPSLVDVSFLNRGAKCARSVARIDVEFAENERYTATAFFISPRRLLTAHHVLFNRNHTAARAVRVVLNYEYNNEQKLQSAVELKARPETIVGDASDDWAIVDIEEVSAEVPPLSIDTDIKPPTVGDQAYIIHHPFGGPKKLSIARNEIMDIDERTIRYLTNTEGGSSGAPVFNSLWQVVAFHHMYTMDGSGARFRNEGIRIERVAAALRERGLLP